MPGVRSGFGTLGQRYDSGSLRICGSPNARGKRGRGLHRLLVGAAPDRSVHQPHALEQGLESRMGSVAIECPDLPQRRDVRLPGLGCGLKRVHGFVGSSEREEDPSHGEVAILPA
jgi:hypothetical protein